MLTIAAETHKLSTAQRRRSGGNPSIVDGSRPGPAIALPASVGYSGAVRIGTLFGIEINVHASWIFVFALVAWALSNPVGPLQLTSASLALRATLGVAGSLLFFGSVLAHELAHSLLARARGIRVRGITLFVFGGSLFEREASDAPGEA